MEISKQHWPEGPRESSVEHSRMHLISVQRLLCCERIAAGRRDQGRSMPPLLVTGLAPSAPKLKLIDRLCATR